MSEQHSLAVSRRWANTTPEERSKFAKRIAIIRHGKMSKKEKRLMVAKMNEGRLKLIKLRKKNATKQTHKGTTGGERCSRRAV